MDTDNTNSSDKFTIKKHYEKLTKKQEKKKKINKKVRFNHYMNQHIEQINFEPSFLGYTEKQLV